MDGKKFALIVIGLIVAAALFVVIVMQLFFKYYDPPKQDGELKINDESSLLTPEQAPTIIVLNSR
ncbi:hypothetical protein [Bacillus ndiopicus]|uniref:hypothetical protein n=1 Tax=Bacillus ndiopicus TaxID=1347368 RepID=UPI0005A6EFF7|nr:hypothetical protein [Bacillus ndiopicus]